MAEVRKCGWCGGPLGDGGREYCCGNCRLQAWRARQLSDTRLREKMAQARRFVAGLKFEMDRRVGSRG
jgi:hypothetical protein